MSDQELNLKLVGEVEKHEELYNYKLPEYSRKDVTEKAWQEVAAELNMTVADCKEKWRNLRTVFMRKIKVPPSGSGGKRKAYYLEEAMQFCLPYIKTSAPPSSGNLPSVPLYSTGDDEGVGSAETPQDSDSQLDISVLVPPQTSQTTLSNISVLPVSQARTSEPFPDTSIPRTQFSSQRKTNLASRNSSAAEADRCVAEYFKAKKAKIQAIETTSSKTIDRQESLKMYLLSLLPELEELNDAQIKLFKRRVFSLIDEISTSSQHQPEISTFHTLLSPQSDSSHFSQTSTHSHATEFYHNFSQNL